MGSGKVCTFRFLGTHIIFRLNKFFDPSTPSRSKVDNGGNGGGGIGKTENNYIFSGH